MAYGEHFKYYFYWDHNSSNSYYKVSFLEDGYASTVTTLTPGPAPFIKKVYGQRDNQDAIIFGSEVSMEVIVQGNIFSTYDAELLESDYKNYIVKLIQDPDGTPVTKWVGYMQPENSVRDFQGYTKVYTFTAIDGLAALKDSFYSSSGLVTGSRLTGFADMLTILKTAMSKTFDDTNFQLDFRIQLGTYSDQMTSTENAFKENEIPQELFSELAGSAYEFNTCYEVIEKIIAPFDCVMAQLDGYYWIWCDSERSTYYFEYDWATLTQQARTATNRTQSIETADFIGSGQLYKLPGLGSFYVNLYNREYSTALITNGTFDANITGWTNGDADDSSNTFNTFAWYDYPLRSGTAGAAWSGGATAGTYNFHSSSTFTLTVGAGASNVNILFQCELNSETRTGGASAVPLVRARLYNATDGYITGTNGQQPFLSVGGFYTFSEVFNVTSMTVAANYLDIEIEIQDSTTTAFQFYFDDISGNQLTGDVPRDWRHYSTRSTGNQKGTKEKTIYIADSQESTSDICSIKDSGGSYTSTWRRYGKTDDIPLIKILMQDVYNRNFKYMSYVKATVYDVSEVFNIKSAPFYGSGVYYKIIGITQNYRDAFVELDMVETQFLTDYSFATTASKLDTQYGETV